MSSTQIMSTTTSQRLSLSNNNNKTNVLPVTNPKLKLLNDVNTTSSSPGKATRAKLGRLRKLHTTSNNNNNNKSGTTTTKNKNFSVPGRAKSFDGISALMNLPDSAPLLPDRDPDSSTALSSSPVRRSRKPRIARSQIFRAAEGGRTNVLPTTTALKEEPDHPLQQSPSLKQRPPLRSRKARSSSSTLNRASFGGFSRVASDQLYLRSRRKSKQSSSQQNNNNNNNNSMDSSFNDSGSFEDLSVDASLPLYRVKEKQRNNPLQYADDEAPNPIHSTASDDASVGTHKKHNARPFSYANIFRTTTGSSSSSAAAASYCPPPHPAAIKTWLNIKMRRPQFITLLLLLGITFFVAGSYRQVLRASGVIEDVKMGESKLLVHMHKVEQQALQFAESLKRLNERNEGVAADAERQVDGDVIRSQIDKLREMESELDHEVRALRKRIQVSAKQSLIEKFGEGAVQVFLDVQAEDEHGQSDGKKHTISIRLWYDTPHSAWTFLQQIEAGVWTGATFSLQQGRSLVADPVTTPLRPSLDFVESSDRGHERYTITLTDNALSINLQDNRKVYRQEACVGVIFEGFDVLHSIVKDTSTKTVKIVQAMASHMKRADASGMF
mmetsp:Transcript_9412/g.20312  ORF Transcript_9412/g.20312 Transcript_9412/m.20312 type:complete len:610 (-) Transcript_9412:471-2300(-)